MVMLDGVEMLGCWSEVKGIKVLGFQQSNKPYHI